MIYFDNKEDMLLTAEKLKPVLENTKGLGVPFTFELYGNGLLTWGIDPPQNLNSSVKVNQSWRSWICRHLAINMIRARTDETITVEPRIYAVNELEASGIDTERWMPGKEDWKFYE